MSDSIQNNKRIAKNTIYMYMRMGVTMLIQLYTSRVILQYLGAENYGIYNVVASFIVSLTFVKAPISSAVQRFLNFELGHKDGNVNSIINLSLKIYSVLSVILLIVIEVAGTWYLNNKISVPDGRLEAARFVFHMSTITLLITIVRSPFESLIIAHEKMSFYACASILEVVLKLLNALSLIFVSIDKLKLFALNQLIIAIAVSAVFYVFCKKFYKDEIAPNKNYEKNKLKEIISFSGWSLFSGIASMTANHGVNILLNAFAGVMVNAAMGIAVQVQSSVHQFVNNFQKAFNPQIVKLYAANDLNRMCKLVSNASRFSYFLLFMIVCPVIFNIEEILRLWLKNVPDGASVFCSFLLIWQLLEALMAPMWTAVNATGKIRKYHLVMSPIILSVIIFSYFALKLEFPVYSVVVIKCLVDVVLLIARIAFVRKMIGFSARKYFLQTICPVSLVTIISVLFLFILHTHANFKGLLVVFEIFVFCLVYIAFVFYFGLKKNEREKLFQYLHEAKNKLKTKRLSP